MSLTTSTFADSSYESEGFKVMIENELQNLRSDPNSRMVSVEPVDANRFEYDFYGLLRVLLIEEKYHWVTLRMNQMHSPADYRANMTDIHIPNASQLEVMYSMFKTMGMKA